MRKHTVIATSVLATAAVIGGGATAYAATNSPSTSTSTSASSARSHHHHRDELRRALHATWVTKGKSGYVTHDAIRGTVSSSSSRAVSVKSADGFSQTFTITSATKFHERGDKTVSATSLRSGEHVIVVGTGSPSSPTATRIGIRVTP